ncbi:hypothetical protein AVEN_39659-1, partial [Araneus ventricosus]
MERLGKLIAEIATNYESINKENKEIADGELVSDHRSSSEEELDNESDISKSTDYLEG